MEKRKRPIETHSKTVRLKTACGNIYVTPGYDPADNCMIEVFASLGKAGGCPAAYLEALGRAISLGLKYGIPASEFIKELKDIRCPSQLETSEGLVLSCPDAVANVLRKLEEENGR